MRLSLTARVRLGFVALALLVVLSGCSYSPPEICGVCGGEVQVAGENHGVDLNATSTEVHIYLHGDGSAKWVERIELNDSGATHLRENVTLRKQILESVTRYESAAPEKPDRVFVEENALVVAYDIPKLAEQYPGGVLVVNRFHRQRLGSSFGYRVGANRAVLHAPDGMVVTNEPPRSQRNRSTVVWQHSVATHTYVAFGPDGSKMTSWLTQAAIATEVARWAAVPVAIASLVSASILGFAVWVLFTLFGTDDALGIRWFELDLWKYLACVSLAILSGAVVVYATAQNSFEALFWQLSLASVLLFAILGWDTKREMGVRWLITLALVGTGPLIALGLVLEMGPGLPGYVASVWSIAVSLIGSVLFFVTSLLSYR